MTDALRSHHYDNATPAVKKDIHTQPINSGKSGKNILKLSLLEHKYFNNHEEKTFIDMEDLKGNKIHRLQYIHPYIYTYILYLLHTRPLYARSHPHIYIYILLRLSLPSVSSLSVLLILLLMYFYLFFDNI